jgi:exopolyphosphatase / guanosine-5'-triphosphate,3'-diphosphate pyrophosphatase
MRVAVIDLGTNTFNLLVADVRESDFTIIHNSKEGVALGMGGINQRKIAAAAMERALHAFELFISICKLHTVNQIRAIGTSALRDAKNADELVNAVRERFGIEIEIIDGLREAQLIYDGVRWSYDFEAPSLIMDIGGGSTEFIRGYEGEELQFCSLDIGVSRAVQLFDLNDPMTAGNQRELMQWFEQKSEALLDFNACTTLVGSSGSFETFYEMVHEEPFPAGIEPIRLNRGELEETLDWIINSTFDQRERHPYIIPIRRKMAPLAALKTKWILEKFDIRKVVISPCSLKEGVLREMIKKAN